MKQGNKILQRRFHLYKIFLAINIRTLHTINKIISKRCPISIEEKSAFRTTMQNFMFDLMCRLTSSIRGKEVEVWR